MHGPVRDARSRTTSSSRSGATRSPSRARSPRPSGRASGASTSTLRQALGLYANLRPARSIKGLQTRYEDVDLVIVRENTEDLYAGIEHMVGPDAAESIKIITRAASERIARFAFEYAVANGRRKVTAVHKANIMKLSDGLFLESCRTVAADYDGPDRVRGPDRRQHVHAARPEAGAVRRHGPAEPVRRHRVATCAPASSAASASRPGANIGDGGAVFEPVHGSAPKYAGLNKANPTALILSGVLMLRHLGEQDAAERVETALREVIAEGKDDDLRPRRDRGHAASSPTPSSRGSADRPAAPDQSDPPTRASRETRRLHAPAVSGQRGDARLGVPPHLGCRHLGVHPAPRPRHLARRAATRSSTTSVLAIYASPFGRVMESLLGAALLYHALNGLRIIIMDFWPSMTRYHKQLWYLSWVLFVGHRAAGPHPDHGPGRSGMGPPVRFEHELRYTRSGRAKPRGGGWELAIWYLMRLTGSACSSWPWRTTSSSTSSTTRPSQDAVVDRTARWAASPGGRSTG